MDPPTISQSSDNTQDQPMDIKMECDDVTEEDYFSTSTMETTDVTTDTDNVKSEVTLPIKMAPPEESMTLEDFVSQETARQRNPMIATQLEGPVLHNQRDASSHTKLGEPDIGMPQVDRSNAPPSMSLPVALPPGPIPLLADHVLSDTGMTSDTSVLTKVDAPQTKNTLLKQIIDKACLKLAREGEESLFLSVNIEKKLCSFVGTETGRQFLTKRPDIMEHFFQFCQAVYKARGDLVTTETTSSTGEDSDFPSSPKKSKPESMSVITPENKTEVSKEMSAGHPMTRSQSKVGKAQTVQNTLKSPEDQPNRENSDQRKSKKPYLLRIGIKPKKYSDYLTDLNCEADERNDDETYEPPQTGLPDAEMLNNLSKGQDRKAKRNARNRQVLEREPVEITEKDFLIDDIFTSTTNRKGHFRCTVCDKTFQWTNAYRYHLKTHPNLKVVADCHNCQICNKKFMTIRDLQSHCRNIHKALNSFECSNCKATFNSAFQYNRHRRQCGEKFPCTHCQETFPSKLLLQNHVRYHCAGEETSEIQIKKEIMSDDDNDENNDNDESKDKNSQEDNNREENENESSTSWWPGADADETRNQEGEGKGEEKKYTCNICLMVLKTEEGFNKHKEIHTEEHNKCSSCGLSFGTRSQLNAHKVKVHKDEDTKFKCQECGRKFLQAWTLYRHNQEAHGKDQIICKECGQFFSSPEDLQAHISVHEMTPAEVKFSCQECGKWFEQGRYLYAHYRVAHKMRKSICRFCGVIVDTPTDLKTHIQENHDAKVPNSCSLCGKAFQSREDLKMHVDEHLKNPKILHCQQCREVFHSKSALELHVSKQHMKEFKVFCSICKKGFKHRGKLKIHMLVHKDARPYQCDVCGMCFKMQSTLICHIKRHDGRSMHKCNYCDKNFRSVEGARNHMLLHHIKPEDASKLKFKVYTCEHCGKMMGQKHLYMRHVRLHTGHRPWKCDECGKTFTIPSALNTHKKIHMERKPYHCDICNLGCVDLTKYNKHLQTSKHQMMVERKSLNLAQTDLDIENEEEQFLQNWNPKGLEVPLNNKGQAFEFKNVFNVQNMIKKAENSKAGVESNSGLMLGQEQKTGNTEFLLQENTALANTITPQIQTGIQNGGDKSNIVIAIPQGMSPEVISQLLQSGQLQATNGNIILAPPSMEGEAEMSDGTVDKLTALFS